MKKGRKGSKGHKRTILHADGVPSEFLEEHRRVHLARARSTGPWTMRAHDLNLVADLVHENLYAAQQEMKNYFPESEIPKEPGSHRIWDENERPPDLVMHLARLEPEFLMLKGMAFECLLKGILFSAPKEEVLKANPQLARSHNLKVIATKIGVEMTLREGELLSILSDHVIWRGRYPVPTEAEDDAPILSPERSNGMSPPYGNSSGDDDFQVLRLLFRKLFDVAFTVMQASGTQTY